MKAYSRVLAIAALCAICLLVAGCSQAASGSGSESAAASSASAQSAASSSSGADASSTVTILLDYNAGTGYEWNYTADPQDAVTLVSATTENRAAAPDITGGSLRDHYTFQAERPGTVTLTFDLKRGWEDEPAETQVFTFVVADDLSMSLNPYESNFANEPEWG